MTTFQEIEVFYILAIFATFAVYRYGLWNHPMTYGYSREQKLFGFVMMSIIFPISLILLIIDLANEGNN